MKNFRTTLARSFALLILAAGIVGAAQTIIRSAAILNSTVDNSNIGATTPASGQFTQVQDTALTASASVCTNGTSYLSSTCAQPGIYQVCTPLVMGSNVNGSLSAVTVGSVTCVFPSAGCPFRALISWNISLNISTNNNISLWVSDGTHNFRDVPANGLSSDQTGASQSLVTPNTYCSQTVVFTLKTQGSTANYVIDAAPLVGSGANHGMDVAMFSSGN